MSEATKIMLLIGVVTALVSAWLAIVVLSL